LIANARSPSAIDLSYCLCSQSISDTKQLLDLGGNPTVAPSIDPFFFRISWPEDEEEREERGFGGIERVENEALYFHTFCYDRLSYSGVILIFNYGLS